MHLMSHRTRNILIQNIVEIAGSYPNILICTAIIDEQSAIDDDIPAREAYAMIYIFILIVAFRDKDGGDRFMPTEL